jgi:uncharacterized protein with PIN domain
MLNRHGPRALRRVNGLIQEAGFQVESVTPQHAHHGLEAYAKYGNGLKRKQDSTAETAFLTHWRKSLARPSCSRAEIFPKRT